MGPLGCAGHFRKSEIDGPGKIGVPIPQIGRCRGHHSPLKPEFRCSTRGPPLRRQSFERCLIGGNGLGDGFFQFAGDIDYDREIQPDSLWMNLQGGVTEYLFQPRIRRGEFPCVISWIWPFSSRLKTVRPIGGSQPAPLFGSFLHGIRWMLEINHRALQADFGHHGITHEGARWALPAARSRPKKKPYARL